ncbi:hypothetical protein ACFQ1S_34790, partial [Kibdelosporangium lantanae]
GRIAHLVDAVEDLEEDRETGAWNPLHATGTSLEEARRLCDDALIGVKLALREAEFTDGKLVHALLVHELDHAVQRAFADPHGHHPHGPQQPPYPQQQPPEKRRRGRKQHTYDPYRRPRSTSTFAGCMLAIGMFCTCQFCCRDPYHDPWTGEPKQGWCVGCDCGDCCDGCDCCDCCCDGCDCCDCSC